VDNLLFILLDMNVKEKKFLYVPEEQTFQIAEELPN
jgi:hypothetical protein